MIGRGWVELLARLGRVRESCHTPPRAASIRSAAERIARLKRPAKPAFLIGVTGFEPAASATQTPRSAKLSYTPFRRQYTVAGPLPAELAYGCGMTDVIADVPVAASSCARATTFDGSISSARR